MNYIFFCTPKESSLNWRSPEDIKLLARHFEGKELVAEFKSVPKKGEKIKMYAYYHSTVLTCAVTGYGDAGYEGVDKVKADFMLRAEFAKDFVVGPNKEHIPIVSDKKDMNKERLLKFLVDCIHFIENDLGVIVPDSQEYKMQIITGRKMKAVKRSNDDAYLE